MNSTASAVSVATSGPEPTLAELLVEARRLADLFARVAERIDGEGLGAVPRALLDVAGYGARRLVRTIERLAACDHYALKHGSREAFDAGTTSIGVTEGPRRLDLGNCRRCGSTIAYVGER